MGKIQIGVKYAIYINNLFNIFNSRFFVASGKINTGDAIGIALHKNSTFLKITSQIEGFESNVQAAYGNFYQHLVPMRVGNGIKQIEREHMLMLMVRLSMARSN